MLSSLLDGNYEPTVHARVGFEAKSKHGRAPSLLELDSRAAEGRNDMFPVALMPGVACFVGSH